jgi:hypothetical protein
MVDDTSRLLGVDGLSVVGVDDGLTSAWTTTVDRWH